MAPRTPRQQSRSRRRAVRRSRSTASRSCPVRRITVHFPWPAGATQGVRLRVVRRVVGKVDSPFSRLTATGTGCADPLRKSRACCLALPREEVAVWDLIARLSFRRGSAGTASFTKTRIPARAGTSVHLTACPTQRSSRYRKAGASAQRRQFERCQYGAGRRGRAGSGGSSTRTQQELAAPRPTTHRDSHQYDGGPPRPPLHRIRRGRGTQRAQPQRPCEWGTRLGSPAAASAHPWLVCRCGRSANRAPCHMPFGGRTEAVVSRCRERTPARVVTFAIPQHRP